MNSLLEVDNISITFGGVRAVRNLSFQVSFGEILGLIGPNGAGKSTCVNMIAGLYAPSNGKIIFDGRELTPKISVNKRVHLGMGRTFQTPKPFGTMSVFENVFAAAMQHSDMKSAAKKTDEILTMMDLYDCKDMLSAKLPIERRKWLDLARLLANDPKFIMLDEVMAGLNPIEMEESLKMIKKINKLGVTILFIEHVMKAVVKLCHRVVVINNGEWLAEGVPQDVLQQKEVVEAYIGGGNQSGQTA